MQSTAAQIAAINRFLESVNEIIYDWQQVVAPEAMTGHQAVEDLKLIRPLIKAAPDLRETLAAGIDAAQYVIDTWSQGDLAAAVNGLEHWLTGARVTLTKAGAQ